MVKNILVPEKILADGNNGMLQHSFHWAVIFLSLHTYVAPVLLSDSRREEKVRAQNMYILKRKITAPPILFFIFIFYVGPPK